MLPVPTRRFARKLFRPLLAHPRCRGPACRHGSECLHGRSCRTARRSEDRLRLRLAIELSLKAPDLIGRFKAHRQSTLSLTIFKSTPEVRALSSAGVTRLHRYYNPVRLPSGPSTYSMLKARPSTRTGLPRLPALPFQRAMPITPVNQPGAYVDCFPICAAFPAIRPGPRSHRNFRGVLRLHSRYGPLDCSAA
jgi:hypothetical protein